ncbi:hypothetical protein HZ994_02555 [Akkermansiaceae bacterium]|nr:hypothetical protein HZ994_02555 [Akkermansiaceae bacterium]
MKNTPKLIMASALAAALASGTAMAQFDSGSNGSYGPMNITSNTTLQLPEDGVFHCTTITIASGATLKFSKNSANTPVYLLATGDVTFTGVNGIPSIDVSGFGGVGVAGGAGGPGGFDGGQGGAEPGDGAGPGGGAWGWTGDSGPWDNKPNELPYRGAAGYSNRPANTNQSVTGGAIYGNALLIPIIGGSGGGGGKTETLQYSWGGGGGGGAVVIASNTRIVFPTNGYSVVLANGGSGTQSGNSPAFGGGSGGAVRLVAPEIRGSIDIRISAANGQGPSGGGMGKIRIDAINRGALQLINNDGFSAQYASFGSNMVVFPPNFPILRIKQVGTEIISDTQIDPVFVLFPAGSTEAQTVRVIVKDFNTSVPLRAVVTPQNGSKQTFDFTVDNSAGGSSEGSVQVNIPAGVASRVDVWTR